MNKNTFIIIIVILVVLCLGEGYFIIKERNAKIAAMQVKSQTMMPKTTPTNRKPMLVMKGLKFSDNPLFSKAHLIAPITGDLSDDAKKALTGWDIKTSNLPDGSQQVNILPHENEDIQQQFTVKPGYKLYFIEMTLVDDSTTNGDANRGDDIGVLVDQNGIIQ